MAITSHPPKKFLKPLLLFGILNFSALALGGLFTGPGVRSDWYQHLQQAPWTPPGWVFGFAWTLIMVCYSFFLALKFTQNKFNRTEWIGYGLSWSLNVLWNPVFFHLHQTRIAIFLLSALLAELLREFLSAPKPLQTARFLLSPYILWLFIACSLNLYICLNNP